MFGKFHTPLRMGRVRVIISCQKCDFSLKHRLTKTALAAKSANFCFSSPEIRFYHLSLQSINQYNYEINQSIKIFWMVCWFFVDVARAIIGVEFSNRQTNKFFDTIYRGMWIFLSVKFAISLLALLARHWIQKFVLTCLVFSYLHSKMNQKSHFFNLRPPMIEHFLFVERFGNHAKIYHGKHDGYVSPDSSVVLSFIVQWEYIVAYI